MNQDSIKLQAASQARFASAIADRNRLKAMLALLLGIVVLGCVSDEIAVAFCVVLLSVIVSVRLWTSVGKDIAISDLAAFIAVLQWITCPFIAFHFPLYQSSRYAMSGTLLNYFTFAVPGTALFLVGIHLVRIWYARPLPPIITVGPSQYAVAFTLVGMALAADILIPFSPSSIQFILKIFSDLKFGAMVVFLYSTHPFRWLVISVLAVFTLMRSRNIGMFHEPLLWATLFTIYAFYRYSNHRKPLATFGAKAAIVLFGCMAIYSLQLVKADFRKGLAKGEDVSVIRMAAERALDFEQIADPQAQADVLVRFNQGWIISRILDNIPRREPFQNGGSFATAAETVVLPRVLFPDRAPVEIAKRFYQFTGVRINENTCMGISLLGEAYGNFGRWGGALAMVVLGIIFSGAVEYTRSLMHRWPMIFFLTGVIFSEPIKAETDSTMVLNYIAKATLVIVALVYLFRQSFSPSVTAGVRTPAKSISY